MHWLDGLMGRNRAERDLDDEIRFHLEQEVQQRMTDGLTREEAEASARREFGNVSEVKEVTRVMWGFSWLERILQDLRYGIRGLLRSPGFTLIAVLSLAVGISVNITIYGFVRNVLLEQPTAYQPDRLCRPVVRTGFVSYANYRDFAESKIFADLVVYNFRGFNWQSGKQTYSVFSSTVSTNFFEVMGIKAARGRTFSSSEARAELSPALAVVSHRFWQRRLEGRADVLGQTLMLDGHAFEIIGVLDEGHHATGNFGLSPEIYVPVSPLIGADLYDRGKPAYQMIGRLPEGVSRETAAAAFREAAKRLEQMYPKDNRRLGEVMGVFVLSGWDLLKAEPGVTPIFVFFGVLSVVVGLVLLIACANVAGLLLARGVARQREMAIRLAIGASRWRLIHQLLVESSMLAVMATAAGLVLHQALGDMIRKIEVPLNVSFHFQMSTDSTLMLFAFAVGLVTLLLCGLAPALQTTRPSLAPALKREESQVVVKRLTLRNVIVVGQVAVSTILLATAFLFVRNLYKISTVSPGFDVTNMAVVETQLAMGRNDSKTRDQFVERVIATLNSLPGVNGVAYAAYLPLGFANMGVQVRKEGTTPDAKFRVLSHPVGPGYFRTIGMRVLQGREFDELDAGKSEGVVAVSQALAARRFPGENAVGKRLLDGDNPVKIVAIVSDCKHFSLGEEPKEIVYRPLARRDAKWYVARTGGALQSLLPGIRDAVQQIDPTAMVEARSMESYLALAFFPSRAGAIMLGVLGGLGLLLALVGLYGVMAYAVTRRVPEIGIRMALGASRSQVLGMVLKDGSVLVAVGTAIGLGLALFATRPLAMLLAEGLRPDDPVTFVSVPAGLIVVGLMACLGPARRAIRIDPIRALRYE